MIPSIRPKHNAHFFLPFVQSSSSIVRLPTLYKKESSRSTNMSASPNLWLILHLTFTAIAVMAQSPSPTNEKSVDSFDLDCDSVSNDGVPKEDVFPDGTSLATSPEDCSTREGLQHI